MPPFKPAAFAGRKDKSANQVAVMELFTGAQCPPCVAADVAFDALLKTYKPTDVVLIQYHVHIPGPDPLTNPDSVARCDYYQKEFPEAVRGAPTSVFNGKPQTGGGGGMVASEAKYKQYVDAINPILEKTTEVKVAGKATRTGDKIDIAMEVVGAAGEDMKLRLLVVEESIGYVGSNQIRFHHQVVRAMPGGAEGVAIKDKAFKHTASTDLGDVKKALSKYLDDFAEDAAVPEGGSPDGHEEPEGDRARPERQDEGDRSGSADRRGRQGRGRWRRTLTPCWNRAPSVACDRLAHGLCLYPIHLSSI